MPKSKRNKVIALTKVKKKPRDNKDTAIEDIREACEAFPRIYLVSIENERNAFIQEVRKALRPGKLVMAKNKVMQVALGTAPATECQDGVHKMAVKISGQCGLLFTDKPPADVQSVLAEFRPSDYARSGCVATATVVLPKGVDTLSKMPHSIESHLRHLGMPTQLLDGKIHLLGDHTVCKEGQELSADAAQVLKIMEIKQAEFKMDVMAHWCKATGAFVDCDDLED
jgi:mRNA turnover protein 4